MFTTLPGDPSVWLNQRFPRSLHSGLERNDSSQLTNWGWLRHWGSKFHGKEQLTYVNFIKQNLPPTPQRFWPWCRWILFFLPRWPKCEGAARKVLEIHPQASELDRCIPMFQAQLTWKMYDSHWFTTSALFPPWNVQPSSLRPLTGDDRSHCDLRFHQVSTLAVLKITRFQ